MQRTSTGFVALSAALLLSGSAHAQAKYRVIPGASSVGDITADGTIVVGTLNTGEAYYWDMVNDPAPTAIGGKGATGVSADGSVIIGNIDHPVTGAQVAARWTQATGWVDIGGITSCGSLSSAYDVSADGNVIVGLSWLSCSGVAFRWTNGVGMDALEHLANGQNRASTVSADGSFIGGFAQGTFNRTPAVWSSDTTGTVFDPDDQGEVYGSNSDGSIYVGTIYAGGTSYSAFYNIGGTQFLMGSLNAGWGGNAVDVSEDGARIVGYDSLGLGGDAWIWAPQTGIERLKDKLAGLGVTAPDLQYCIAVSDDGTKIVGHNFFGDAWVVTLPRSEVETYGCVNPLGSLTVQAGVPAIGTTLTIGIDSPNGAAANPSTGALLLSLGASANFPCGTVLPGAGELLIALPWAVGIVAPAPWTTPGTPTNVNVALPANPAALGLEIYAQGLLTAPFNTKLTEGLKITLGTD